VELELWRKGQLVPDDDDDELEDPKAVATASLSTESSDPGKLITQVHQMTHSLRLDINHTRTGC
jgi:hypothetical protein